METIIETNRTTTITEKDGSFYINDLVEKTSRRYRSLDDAKKIAAGMEKEWASATDEEVAEAIAGN